MNNDKLSLKGSIYGVKKYKIYKNPHILHSNVDKHLCQINDFKITYFPEQNNFRIYHSYYGLDKQMGMNYTGRWYISNFIFSPKQLNTDKKTLTITLKSIDWEDFDTGKIKKKNVKITIYFTDIGFKKLNTFISYK